MESTKTENIDLDVYDPPSEVKSVERTPNPIPPREKARKSAKVLNIKTCLIIAALLFICASIAVTSYLFGYSKGEESREISDISDKDEFIKEFKVLRTKVDELSGQSLNQRNVTALLEIYLENILKELNETVNEEKTEFPILVNTTNLFVRIENAENAITQTKNHVQKDLMDIQAQVKQQNDSFSETIQQLQQDVQRLETAKLVDCSSDRCLHYNNGWITIQRRLIFDVHFYRTWGEYEAGFRGWPTFGDIWIGLKTLHELTNNGSTWIMRTEFESWLDNQDHWIEYTGFSVGDTESKYVLTIGSQTSGSFSEAGTSWGWQYHDGMKFTTYDADNDLHDSLNCGKFRKGGWWYNGCAYVNLNSLRATSASEDNTHMYYYHQGYTRHLLKSSLIKIKPL